MTREITFRMGEAEWTAFAQLIKRIDYETCHRFAAVSVTYNGRCEGDVIWCAIYQIGRQLAAAGYAPR